MEPVITEQYSVWTDLAWLFPECFLSAGLVVLVLYDTFSSNPKWITLKVIYLITMLVYLAISVNYYLEVPAPETFFTGLFRSSGPAYCLRLLLGFLSLPVILFPEHPMKHPGVWFGGFIALTIGASLLIFSHNLLSIYLAIELMSLSGYILVALSRTANSPEASVKYLIFGTVSTGIMLYGMSWLYGLTGELNLNDAFYHGLSQAPSGMLVLSLIMILAGILFKVGAFPFQVWIPDVYQGSRGSLAAFLSVVPKTATLFLLFKIQVMFLTSTGQNDHSPMSIIVVCALGSMLIGNFAALRQSNFKRTIAYSSISHSGMLLLLTTQNTFSSFEALVYYFFAYGLMNYGVFWFIETAEQKYKLYNISDYVNHARQLYIPVIFLTIALTALVGLPPTAGFTAKLLLFSTVWNGYLSTNSGWLLAGFVTGLLMTFVSLFYYMQIPYQVLIRNLNFSEQKPIGHMNVGVLVVFSLLLLVLFFVPNLLLNRLNDSIFVF
jgi:NADH-quinone oxidoreductase subunit N